jgi:hypothetical protein
MFFNHSKSIGILTLLILLTSGAQAVASDDSTNGPKWSHDPFRYASPSASGRIRSTKQAGETGTKSDINGLKGIFVSNGVYHALYDGKLVKNGERIGSTLIRKIALYSIIIEDGAGRRRIELFNEK